MARAVGNQTLLENTAPKKTRFLQKIPLVKMNMYLQAVQSQRIALLKSRIQRAGWHLQFSPLMILSCACPLCSDLPSHIRSGTSTLQSVRLSEMLILWFSFNEAFT